MDLKAIEQLLEKYLQAETSLQEEAQLREYFSSGDVPPHLQEYTSMFTYFSASRSEKYSGEAFQGSKDAIGNLNEPKTAYKDQDGLLPEAWGDKSVSINKIRKEVYSWVAVAASIIIMAGIFLQEEQRASEFGSYDDPEVAMEKTKEALNMVSQLMNSGKDDLRHLSEFNKTTDKITK